MENRRIKIKNKPLWRFNTRLDGPEKRITEYKIEEMIDLHPAWPGLQGHVIGFKSRTLGVKWNLGFLTFEFLLLNC